jgi:trehalose 2-sulfotransferase
MRYIICCTTRTGSSLLCDLLSQTGLHGIPHEYFEAIPFAELGWGRGPFATFEAAMANHGAYLQWLSGEFATPNGAFGLKVQARQFQWFAPALGDAELAGARFVRLQRRDRLAQAISGVKALQTGAWHSGIKPAAEPVFDPQAIELQLVKIADWERLWDKFFAAQGVEPLSFDYEHIAADYAGVLMQVCEHIGLPLAEERARALQPRLEVQADHTNVEWRRDFEAWRARLEVRRAGDGTHG